MKSKPNPLKERLNWQNLWDINYKHITVYGMGCIPYYNIHSKENKLHKHLGWLKVILNKIVKSISSLVS